jgi:hypothetical protein
MLRHSTTLMYLLIGTLSTCTPMQHSHEHDHTYERTPRVYFDVMSVIKQDKNARGKYIQTQLNKRFWYTFNPFTQLSACSVKFLGVRDPFNALETAEAASIQGMRTMDSAVVTQFPHVQDEVYEAYVLPKYIALVHQDIVHTQDAQNFVHTFYDAQDMSPEEREFRKAIALVAICPEVTRETCTIDPLSIDAITLCKEHSWPCILTGNSSTEINDAITCDERFAQLKRFDTHIFSCDLKKGMPHSTFFEELIARAENHHNPEEIAASKNGRLLVLHAKHALFKTHTKHGYEDEAKALCESIDNYFEQILPMNKKLTPALLALTHKDTHN